MPPPTTSYAYYKLLLHLAGRRQTLLQGSGEEQYISWHTLGPLITPLVLTKMTAASPDPHAIYD